MPTWGTSQMNGLLVDCYQGHLNVTIPKPEPVTCGDAERGRYDRFHIVRPRQSYDELIGMDSLPDWL